MWAPQRGRRKRDRAAWAPASVGCRDQRRWRAAVPRPTSRSQQHIGRPLDGGGAADCPVDQCVVAAASHRSRCAASDGVSSRSLPGAGWLPPLLVSVLAGYPQLSAWPGCTSTVLRLTRPAWHMACVPGGDLVVLGHAMLVEVWSRWCGRRHAVLRDHATIVSALCALSDGSQRVLVGGGGMISCFDLAASSGDGGELRPVWEVESADGSSRIRAIVELGRGRFACAAEDYVHVFEMPAAPAAAAAAASPLSDRSAGHPPSLLLSGIDSPVRCLAPAGAGILMGGSDHYWLQWEVDGGRLLAATDVVSDCCAMARLSDEMVAVGCSDGSIALLDAQRCIAVGYLRGHVRAVTQLAALPEKHLVSISTDHTVRIWEWDSQRCVGELSLSSRAISLGIDGCGDALVGCHDGSIVMVGRAWHRRRVALMAWAAGPL